MQGFQKKIRSPGVLPLALRSVADPLQTSLYPAWVTMPNLVIQGQTVLVYLGVLQKFGNASAPYPRVEFVCTAGPLETSPLTIWVSMLNLVNLGETLWAYIASGVARSAHRKNRTLLTYLQALCGSQKLRVWTCIHMYISVYLCPVRAEIFNWTSCPKTGQSSSKPDTWQP